MPSAGNLSLREVGDIAHALSKHGLSHDPLLSALTQRVCTVADSFQQHQPQARGQHHHQRSWQQRGKPAATTWALDHDFDDCDVWSDAAADGPAPVEQQAAQQKPVKQTTSISSSAMPRENPSETDVRMARARMAEFVRQATGQTATLTATTQHSKAAPSSGKASSTQQLMDLIAAARSIAGEWKGQGQVERMRMVSTVLDAVSWTCPEPHVQPAAWPVVAGVAELCVITRHTDEVRGWWRAAVAYRVMAVPWIVFPLACSSCHAAAWADWHGMNVQYGPSLHSHNSHLMHETVDTCLMLHFA